MAIRALPDLCGGIVSERLETSFPLGHSPLLGTTEAPARPGLSFNSCVSAATEPGGKCGVGQLVMAPLAAGAKGKS